MRGVRAGCGSAARRVPGRGSRAARGRRGRVGSSLGLASRPGRSLRRLGSSRMRRLSLSLPRMPASTVAASRASHVAAEVLEVAVDDAVEVAVELVRARRPVSRPRIPGNPEARISCTYSPDRRRCARRGVPASASRSSSEADARRADTALGEWSSVAVAAYDPAGARVGWRICWGRRAGEEKAPGPAPSSTARRTWSNDSGTRCHSSIRTGLSPSSRRDGSAWAIERSASSSRR